MKSSIKIYLLILLFFTTCQEKAENSALKIVNQSIDTHGGIEAWENIIDLSFQKRVIMYASDGNIKSDVVQYHHYDLNPDFSGGYQLEIDSAVHSIHFDGESVQVFKNEENVTDTQMATAAMEGINAAVYAVGQPFKLLDPGTILKDKGITTLPNGQEAIAVAVYYQIAEDPDNRPDEWIYYFDKTSYLLVACEVNHGEYRSFIENISYDSSTPIVWNNHRKSYRMDKDRNIEYLIAEYYYSDFQLNTSN